MSEPDEADSLPVAADVHATPGAMLRQAREAQGLHLGALATQLKVAPRKLEALEADRYDELQGATFVRALAQAACRALKIDPAPVLARLPRAEAHKLEHVSNGLNAPFRERGGKREPAEQLLASRGFLGLIALLVIAALALWLLPRDGAGWRWLTQAAPESVAAASAVGDSGAASAANGAEATGTHDAGTPVMADAPLANVPQANLPLAGDAGSPAPVVSQPAPVAQAPASAALPAVKPAASSVAALAAVEAASKPQPAASAGLDPAGPLQLHARQDSWIEVIDGSGKTLLARTVAAGDTVGLSGAFPMRVKIGNAVGTDLTLRGKPIELQSLTRDNVVRLELK